MKLDRRTAIYLSAYFLVGTAFSFLLTSNLFVSATSSERHTMSSKCFENKNFQLGYQRESNGIVPLNDAGYSLQGISYLFLQVCEPGQLNISGDGEPALNIPPILRIGLDNDVLEEISLSKKADYSLRIPRAGLITLGYFNDYYKADVRILEMQSITSENCQKVGMSLDGKSGGTIDTLHQSFTLYADNMLFLEQCADGIITFKVNGTYGNSAYPTVSMTQNGAEISKFSATDKTVKRQVFAKKGVVAVRILNPYGKTVADRNLNLYSLRFIPDPK